MIPNQSGGYDIGVIVGRFQLHELHRAHSSLIQSVTDTHKKVLIVLGLSLPKVTHRNPLDFEARKQMLLDAFPAATVLYIKDERDDQVWSDKLDRLVDDYRSPAQTVCLYGGKDSFIARYHGKLPTCVLEPATYVSATELRKTISKSVRGTPDFRAGVIWASANGYPRAFPTVDVAVLRGEIPTFNHTRGDSALSPCDTCRTLRADREWLLVRKPHEEGWRFPGGFVQPSDQTYEMAARREVEEETGVSIADLRYVTSLRVDDWRYRSEEDKILTTFFRATYQFGPVRPADDVNEARWFKTADLVHVVPEHQTLVTALLGGGQ